MPRVITQGMQRQAIIRQRQAVLNQQQQQQQQQQQAQQYNSEIARIDELMRNRNKKSPLRDISKIRNKYAKQYLRDLGYSESAVKYAEDKYGPQFKVYGAKAKDYQYTSDSGKVYTGPRAMVEARQQADIKIRAQEAQRITGTQSPSLTSGGTGITGSSGIVIDIANDRILVPGRTPKEQIIIPGSTQASKPVGEVTQVDTGRSIRVRPGVYLNLPKQKVDLYYEQPTEFDLMPVPYKKPIGSFASMYSWENIKASAKDVGYQFTNPRYFLEDVGTQGGKYVGSIYKALATTSSQLFKPGELYSGIPFKVGISLRENKKSEPYFSASYGANLFRLSNPTPAEAEERGFYYGSFLSQTAAFTLPGSSLLVAGVGTEGAITAIGKNPERKDVLSRVTGGIVAGISFAGLSYGGYKYLTEPVYLKSINPRTGRLAKTFQMPDIVSNPKDIIIPTQGGGSLGTTISNVVRSPSYQFTTTRLKQVKNLIKLQDEFANVNLKIVSPTSYYQIIGVKGLPGTIYSKPKTNLLGEQVSVVENAPLYFRQRVTSAGQPKGNVKYPFIIGGTQQRITSQELASVFKYGKSYQKQLAEVTGISREGDIFVREFSGARSLGRFNLRTGVIKLPVAGRTTFYSESFVKASPLFETDEFVSYTFKRSIRGVRGTNPRRLYLPQEISGQSFVFKKTFEEMFDSIPKITYETKPSTQAVSGISSLTPSVDKQLLEQVKKIVAPTAVPIPRTSITLPKSQLKLAQVTTKLSVASTSQLLKQRSNAAQYPVQITQPLTREMQIQTPVQRPAQMPIQILTPVVIPISRTTPITIPVTNPIVISQPVQTGTATSIAPRIFPRKVYEEKIPLYEKQFPKNFNILRPNQYVVSVRRFGKFKPIGSYTSLRQAFESGRRKVTGTLAATFKIKGLTQPGTPKGFYSKYSRKEGRLFIQQPKYRLSSAGEKGEIKLFGKINRRRTKRRYRR